jgi:hypothetical protein
MNINTIISALIASLIAFTTGALALLQQPDAISSKAWIVLGVGTCVTFLKDFQTLWTRVMASKVTGRDVNIPDKYLPPANPDSAP